MNQYLKRYWGYDSFRPLQSDIIQSVLDKKDTIALLPTGGGKSLCYQVPAVMSEGICLVVSPLISLMQDQVNDLNERGIKAMNVSGMLNSRQVDSALDNAVYGNFKLLYVSPERIQSDLFRERFKRMNISFIAVDEAHCISQWGYDFRPSYLDISSLRELKDVPVMALTATATDSVMKDIAENLKMTDKQTFKKSFARENISFLALNRNDKLKELQLHLGTENETAIIYVRSRKMCAEINSFLNSEGINSSYYHAGLSHANRKSRQESWMNGETSVMVATNAFGMGIDKDNVRTVIHWDLPDSIEAYYQEAGRAGRDGNESKAIMLWNDSDIYKLQKDHEKSFPSKEIISIVYQQLINHYQLGSGDKESQSFNYSLEELAISLGRRPSELHPVLKELEKRNILVLNDGFYIPSMLRIELGKQDLHRLMKESKSMEKLLTFLLRNYPGILENETEIDENFVSKKMGIERQKLDKLFNYLTNTGSVQYRASSGRNMFTFTSNRPEPNELKKEDGDYKKRQDWHLKRVNAMMDFVQTNECRQQFILNYFDESSENKCGKCDNCLRENSKELNDASLMKVIEMHSDNGEISLSDLTSHFDSISKEVVLEMCRTLNESGKIKFIPPDGLKLTDH